MSAALLLPSAGRARRCGAQALLVIALFLGFTLAAAETLPPRPSRYVNDRAGVLSRPTEAALERELEQFERDTSNQILVALFRTMESESSVEDYTQRLAESWKVGQKGRNNGAVLFVFVEQRQIYIQVGYGLEPVLTDARCAQIIRNVITPRFRVGDYSGGVRAGVHAMMAAAKGEYTGTGRTAAARGPEGVSGLPVFLFFLLLLAAGAMSRRRQRRVFGRRASDWRGPGGFGGWGGFGGFGGSSGGGFSGGGGSFGGGGAGGRW